MEKQSEESNAGIKMKKKMGLYERRNERKKNENWRNAVKI